MELKIVYSGVILLAGLASEVNAAQSVTAPILLSQSTEPTGAYYEQNGSNVCGTASSSSSGGASSSGDAGNPVTVCKIDFAAAPTGKYLIIEHVACNLVLEANSLADISLASASGVNDIRLVPLEPTPETQNGSYYYSVNDSVLYGTRTAPRIVLHPAAAGVLHMTCQISGHLNVNK
jgi:hypothetical protein